MQLPYSEKLNIGKLSRIFNNKSECYKLFWFKAILKKIKEGKRSITYDELINEMIAEAWYMVTEYHLNLGPKDNLENTVKYISQITQMKPSEKKENVLDYLNQCTDKEVLRLKNVLASNVPYRLQAPLLIDVNNEFWSKGGNSAVIQRINKQEHLLYYFSKLKGLNTAIFLQEEWVDYITQNQEIIEGWLQYNMIIYLQKRNPSVPGISDKLYLPQERKLDKVKKYWKTILEIQPINEIYGNNVITKDNITIDHFVPWSYVAHDELWNLHPTTKSINSSKSNNLPDWERYFKMLCKQEYLSYKIMWDYEIVHEKFENCAKEHLNSWDVKQKLYRNGLSESEFGGILEEIISPVYNSAKNCGFREWVYSNEQYN